MMPHITHTTLLLGTVLLALASARVLDDDDDGVTWPVLCPPRTYYSTAQEKCLTCASCPRNYIVWTPCQGTQDTECRPYYDLKGVIDSAHRYDVPNNGVPSNHGVASLSNGAFADNNDAGATAGANSAEHTDNAGRSKNNKINNTHASSSSVPSSPDATVQFGFNNNNKVVEDSPPIVPDWQFLVLCTAASVCVAGAVLVVGVVCIKRRLKVKVTDKTGGEYTAQYTAAPPEPQMEDV